MKGKPKANPVEALGTCLMAIKGLDDAERERVIAALQAWATPARRPSMMVDAVDTNEPLI